MASDTIYFSPEEIDKLASVIEETKNLVSTTTNEFIEKNVKGELAPKWVTRNGERQVQVLTEFLQDSRNDFVNMLENKERGMREVARLARQMEQL
ncbi:MAG: hypothetical protein IJH13_01225 [Bacilli bacterium]|nr:hypothetical protein [Bacilli bacterium]